MLGLSKEQIAEFVLFDYNNSLAGAERDFNLGIKNN